MRSKRLKSTGSLVIALLTIAMLLLPYPAGATTQRGAPVITNLTASGITTTSAVITWSTGVPSDTKVQYGLTSGALLTTSFNGNLVLTHAVLLSGLTPGQTYFYKAISSNSDGTTPSEERSFVTTDTTAPGISGRTASGITTSSATISWVTDEAATSQVEYGTTTSYGASEPAVTPDHTNAANRSTSHSVYINSLSAGAQYHYRVRSKDAAGNTAVSADSTFTTLPDTTAPAISNVQTSGIGMTGATVSWVTDEEATSQVAYGAASHSGSTYASISAVLAAYTSASALTSTLLTSHGVAITGLATGTTYYYRVLSKDETGNGAWSAESSFSTSTDVTAPSIVGVGASGTTATSTGIIWTTDEPATSQVAYGPASHAGVTYASIAAVLAAYTSASAEDTTLETGHSVSLSGLTPGATYYYRVLSKDAQNNGNWSTEQSLTTAAPTISGVGSSGVTADEADIAWATDVPASTQVAYGLASHAGSTYASIAAVLAAYTSSTGLDAILVTTHSDSISGLDAGTTYYYRVLSKDAAGNEVWSAEQSFTTLPDSTPPTISSIGQSLSTGTTITITWGTDESATSQVEYGLTVSYGASTPATAPDHTNAANRSTDHSVALTGLTPGQTYHFRVKSKDASGNGAVSADGTFITVGDVTAPVIDNVTDFNVTTSGAFIFWSTSEAADSQVAYSAISHNGDTYGSIAAVLAAYSSSTTLDAALVTSHTVPVSGLTQGVTYYYRVLSKDASGNGAWSNEDQLTTVGDVIAPTISAVTSLPTMTAATVTWVTDETANSQVTYSTTTHSADAYTSFAAAIAAYGQSSPLSSTLAAGHAVTLSGLTPATTYYYRVLSADEAGNEAVSDEYSVTTQALSADTTPPTISGTATPNISMNAAIVSWTTNEPATSQVAYSSVSHAFDPAIISGSPTIAGVVAAYRVDGAATAEDAVLRSSHGVTLLGLSPGVTYYYRVLSKDSAAPANESFSLVEFSFTTLADTAPPVISNVASSGATAAAATIEWTTDEAATSQVVFDTAFHSSYSAYPSAQPSATPDHTNPSNRATSHSVTLTLPGAEGAVYHYRVLSKDSNGNLGVSGDFTFTSPDVSAPVLTLNPLAANPTSDNTPTFSGSATDAGSIVGSVEYQLAGEAAWTAATFVPDSANPKTGSYGMTLPALPDGAYTLLVRATDSQDNVTSATAYLRYAFTVDSTAPTAPALTSPTSNENVNDSTPTFGWAAVVDPSGVTYELVVADNSAFTAPSILTPPLTVNSFTPTAPLSDTRYYWRVRAKDGAGNQGPWSDARTFSLDGTDPVVTIGALSPDPTTDTTPSFTGSASDALNPIVAVEYRVDGGAWTAATFVPDSANPKTGSYSMTLPALLDGTHTVQVRAEDGFGNWIDPANYASDAFITDSTGPTVTIQPFPFNATNDNTPTFTGTAHDATTSISAVEYRVLTADGAMVLIDWTASGVAALDGVFNSADEAYTLTTTTVSDGPRKIEVRAKDVVNNPGSASYAFEVDTVPPELTISTPLGRITNDNTPSFAGNATDHPSTFVRLVEYNVDDGAWASAQPVDGSFDTASEDYRFTVSVLADGWHTVKIRASDAAGNTTQAANYGSDTFFVDTLAPNVTINRLDFHPYAAPPATFTGTVNDSTPSSNVTALQFQLIGSNGATVVIAWTSQGVAAVDGAFNSAVEQFRIVIDPTPPLLEDTSYFLYVKATDLAGNTSVAIDYEDGFKITSRPLANVNNLTANDTGTWVTDDRRTRDKTPAASGEVSSAVYALSKVEVRVDGGAWTATSYTPHPTKAKTWTWQYTLPALADGRHYVQVRAFATNPSTLIAYDTPAAVYAEGGAGYMSFTIDTTPPVVSGVETINITTKEATVKWATNEPSTGFVVYGKVEKDTVQYDFTSARSDNLGAQHQIILTDLKPGSEYRFKVKAIDDVGNETYSAEYSFQTAKPLPIGLIAIVVGALVLLALIGSLLRGRGR